MWFKTAKIESFLQVFNNDNNKNRLKTINAFQRLIHIRKWQTYFSKQDFFSKHPWTRLLLQKPGFEVLHSIHTLLHSNHLKPNQWSVFSVFPYLEHHFLQVFTRFFLSLMHLSFCFHHVCPIYLLIFFWFCLK